MAQLLSGTRVYGTATIDTQLLVNGTQSAVSTTTGAIQVVGGIGVGNSVFVGNALTVTNLIRVLSTNNATSTQTGGLQVIGGVGIGQDLRVGGTIYGNIVGTITGVITTATNLAGGTSGQIPFQVNPGVTSFAGAGTSGQLLVSRGASTSGPLFVNTSSIYVGRTVQSDNLSGGTAGAIPYQSGDNATTFLPIGNASFILASTGSAPVWVSTASLVASAALTADKILMTNESADSSINYITFVSTTTGYTDLKGHATSGITYKPSTIDFGIGTNNPGYKLHVVESANDPAARFQRAGSGNVIELYNTSGLTADFPALGFLHRDSGTNAIAASRIAGFSAALAAGAVSGGLYFYTMNAGTEALAVTIDKDGNLGIGITPTNKLDVAGTARISGITSITNTTAGTNPTTGALVVSGGVGVSGSVRASGQFVSTQANNAANGSAQIYLNGATGNRIDFNTNGVAAPAFTTRSAGTKIVLYPNIGAAAVDYAFGIESNTLWSSVPSSSAQFKWYGGTTNIATLSGGGNLTITGDLAVNGGDLTSTQSSFNLLDTGVTTLNFARAATNITIGNSTGGTTTVRTNLAITTNTNATSFSTGALTVAGGAGITGDLYVGGTFYGNVSVSGTITTATNIAGGTAGQVPYQTGPGATSFFGPGTAGNVLVSNGTSAPTYNNTLALAGTTAASSPSTGALTVAGGAGIGGALYAGGLLSVGSTGAFASDVTVGSASRTANSFVRVLAGDAYNAGFEAYGNSQGTGYIYVGQSSTYGGGIFYNGDGSPAFATGETSDWIGFYRTDNGVRNVVFHYSYISNDVTFRGNITVAGDAAVNGGDLTTTAGTFNLVNANATTVNFAQAATTLSMGATTGNTTVRNNLTVAGNLTVQGTTTQVNSTVTNVSDPIFVIGTGPNGADQTSDDSKDRGIAFKWHNGSAARTGFFGFDDSTGFFTFVPQATITNEVVSGTRGAIDINLAGGAAGSIPYQSAANTTLFLPIGTENKVLTSKSGITAGVATQVEMTNDNASTTRQFVTFVSTSTGAASVKASASTGITWIPSSKYFGLGIETPLYPLHINVASGLASIGLSGTAANAQTMRLMQGTTGVSNSGFSIYDVTTSATRFMIGSGGNVGIGTGTQNPSDRLHISNSGGTAQLRVGDTASTQVGLLLQRRNGGVDTQTHWFSASANSPWYLFGQNLTWTGERAGTVTSTHSYKPYYEAYVPISGYKEFGFVNATSGAFTSASLIPNMVLKNDGNVGIGTTNPTFKLHIVNTTGGDGTYTGGILVENTNATTTGEAAIGFKNAGGSGSGSNLWLIGMNQDTNFGFYYGTNFTDGNAKMSLGSDGNLIVGGADAAFTTGSGIEIQRSGTTTLRLDSGSFATELYGYTGGTGLFQLSAGYLDLGTSNTIRVRILSGGNVGINTTTPAATLDVNGGTFLRGVTTVTNTTNASSPTTGALQVAGGAGISNNLYVGGNAVVTGDVAVNGGDLTTTAGSFNLVNSAATTINFGGAGTAITVGATSGSTTVRNQLRATIGTQASSTTTGALVVTNNGGAGIGGNLYVGGNAVISGTLTASSISGTTTNATNVNITNETASASTHYLTFVTGTGNQAVKIDNAELAFIPSTGRLGIGNVAPAYKLDVSGEFRQTGDNIWFDGASINLRGDQVFNFLTDGGNAQTAKFKSIQVSTSYSGTIPDNGILFSTDSNLYRTAATTLRTNSSFIVDGNLGVNDTSPNIRLSVLQNSDVWHARFGATATTKQLRIGGNASAGPVIGAYNTGDNSSPSALMINRDGGQVIIGSSTAFATSTVPLYVRGGTSGWVVFERNNKKLYLNANYSDANSAAQISPLGTDNMALSLSARETLADLYLTTNGRIGMGTTSPVTNLDIRVSNSGTQSPQVNGITLRTNQGNGMEWHLANSNGYTGWVAAARVNSTTSAFGSGYLEFITAGSSGGNQQSVLTLHGNGNVTIGQVAASDYRLFVNGSFAATTKSFVIDHPSPDKAGWKLRYASLEGPENGVYIRGRLTNNNVIHLPDYWRYLVDVNSISVEITPVGKYQKLYVEKIQPHFILIATESDQPVNCFYTVYAERKDVDKLVVEYEE
jgi:hypothetical protein